MIYKSIKLCPSNISFNIYKKVIRYMISSFKYIIYVLNVWKLKIENVTMNLIISLHHACIFVTETKESNHLLIFSLINYKEQEGHYVN
jgi:ABC-type maltose transport system permease subunit